MNRQRIARLMGALACVALLSAPALAGEAVAAKPVKPAKLSKAEWSQLVDLHTRGGTDARVQIVEFTDLECPFCKRASATLDLLVGTYGDEIRHTVLHNPLSFHRNARNLAEASAATSSPSSSTTSRPRRTSRSW